MAAKDKGAIVSGAGWLAGFAEKLTDALRQRGVSNEDIHGFVTEKGDVPVGKIADVVAEAMLSARNVFRVLVDYGKRAEDAVRAGKYDWSDPYIHSKNSPDVHLRGEGEVEIHLIHFNRYITSEDAVSELDTMGFRPTTSPELFSFGVAHPDKQREFPIVALGSVWRGWSGGRFVPGLWSYAGGRNLLLRVWDGGWGPGYRFAAVRK